MKHLLEKMNSFAGFLVAISIIIILLITSIDMNSFNKVFYQEEYERLNTANDLGMTEKDLNLATTTLLDYLQDKRDDIEVTVQIKGSTVEAFNSKEASHMVDVKGLYQFALILRNVSILVLGVGLIFMFIRMRKGAFTIISINFMKTAILFAVFLTMLAGWAYVDFDAFWTTFHKIAFRNDLWLLDPSTDLMINLFPAEFFSKLVFHIVGMFTAAFISCFLISYVYLRRQLHKLHKELVDNDALS